MASRSNHESKAIIAAMVGGVAYSPSAHLYIALCTVVPTDVDTGSTITETNYSGYARTEIGTGNNQTDAWNVPTGTTIATVTNKNIINCPTAAGPSTNPIVGLAVVDSASGGNIKVWMPITSTPIVGGDEPQIGAGGLVITDD